MIQATGSPYTPQGPHRSPNPHPPHRGTTGSSAQVDAGTQRSGDLEIVTAEGDKVSISFAAISRLRAVASEGSAQASAASGLEVQVKVNGNLSQNEIADIAKLMDSLGNALGDIRRGDLQQASQDLAPASSLVSLAGFRFAYQEQTNASASLSSTRNP